MRATLLRRLPDGCLDRLFLLFPDPWPKARHAKRRFVHPAQLPLLARVMRPGAEWRIASDDPTYQAWVDRGDGRGSRCSMRRLRVAMRPPWLAADPL